MYFLSCQEEEVEQLAPAEDSEGNFQFAAATNVPESGFKF